MFKFTLPNIYENKKLNNFLIQLNKTHPEYFKCNVNFIQESGAMPYCSWSGYNSNIGAGITAFEFTQISRYNHIPIRLNFANILLENFDFEDCMGQAILKAMHNGSNLIEISNLELMDYILEKYPNYKFIFSKQADLVTDFTPEILNQFVEVDKFELIGIPDKYTKDFDFLNGLQKKSKFEITVNYPCPINCRTYKTCAIQEHKTQLAYSGIPVLWNCKKCYAHSSEKSILSLEELKEKYVPLGFSNFTFSHYTPTNANELLDFYLSYFIKTDCYDDAYKFWMGGKY